MTIQMYKGRFQHFFYAGMSKLVGLGVFITVSLIYSLCYVYVYVSYEAHQVYTVLIDSFVILIDIIFFSILAIGFIKLNTEDRSSAETKQITVSSVVFSVFLFIDIILLILLNYVESVVIYYVYGTFNLITGFSAIYVCLKIYRYFNRNTKLYNLKIINYSFIILGFALFFQYLFMGIHLISMTFSSYLYYALKYPMLTASSIGYVVFIIVATGLIIYSKKGDKIFKSV